MNKANNSKFVTRKWNIANDQSNANYAVGNEKIFDTEVLISSLSGCNDACTLIRRDIIIIGHKAT